MVDLVHVDAEIVLAAAGELDLLADRLAAAQGLSGPGTHVIPSGAEEVSLLASNHFNEGAATHDASIAQGIVELRNAAQTLRIQVTEYVAQDAVRAAGITAVQTALEL
ncbi:PE family protein [Nocardia macrotermitis]|uniref:PE domain-containing protein n=1 Tax=Nocardia macrotermitis TaxID=2585198 RepID=A0A7K0DAL4_9NOCA|nr:PE family protein [Nocardia macrotermitis]MQY22362.1 hypothetical protein [Nocardia macrotermitis]